MPSSQSGAHALRKGRYSQIGQFYSVTGVTHMRQPLFADWQMGRLVVAEFRWCAEQGLVESLAWVVMPDHFHWLLALRSGSVDRLMKSMRGRSAQAINRARSGCGPVWQRGYHDHAVRGEEDVKAIARYIIANPLRAGIVRRVGDYSLWDAAWL